jgi:hypothetical protein
MERGLTRKKRMTADKDIRKAKNTEQRVKKWNAGAARQRADPVPGQVKRITADKDKRITKNEELNTDRRELNGLPRIKLKE